MKENMIDCPECEGSGELWTGYQISAAIGSWAECGDTYTCDNCNGTGAVEGEEDEL